MRWLTLPIVLVCVLGVSGQAPEKKPEPWANKLFGGKLTHDFGTVRRGTQLRHEFEVTNIYTVPLEITNVKYQAGAVRVTTKKTVLQPNEKTTIILTIDTGKLGGRKADAVFVTIGPKWMSTAKLRWVVESK